MKEGHKRTAAACSQVVAMAAGRSAAGPKQPAERQAMPSRVAEVAGQPIERTPGERSAAALSFR